MESSGGFIQREGFPQNPVSEVGAEEAGRQEIHLSAEESRKLSLDGDEPEADGRAGLELDENVDIAFRTELAPQSRAEESQPTYAMPPTKALESRPVEGQRRRDLHEIIVAPRRKSGRRPYFRSTCRILR